MLMTTTLGAFKQDVLRVYNEINKKIFNCGVKQQKVEVIGNKIVLISIHPRIPVLRMMDRFDPSVSRTMDRALQRLYKEEIKREFEQAFRLQVIAVLKDYDAETEFSGTVVILDRDLNTYLND
jgi:hypothetical protein